MVLDWVSNMAYLGLHDAKLQGADTHWSVIGDLLLGRMAREGPERFIVGHCRGSMDQPSKSSCSRWCGLLKKPEVGLGWNESVYLGVMK